MAMSKLSPGGWHRGAGNGEGSIFADEGRIRLEKGGTTLYPICKMVTGWDPEQDEFNAQLVAAAPAMFRKLKDTVAWLDREIEERENSLRGILVEVEISSLIELRDDLAETLRKIESSS